MGRFACIFDQSCFRQQVADRWLKFNYFWNGH
jgi:hypothetical protein